MAKSIEAPDRERRPVGELRRLLPFVRPYLKVVAGAVASLIVAAGILLVREAGGFVTDLAGGADMLSDGAVMAGNEALQPRVLEIVRRARGG